MHLYWIILLSDSNVPKNDLNWIAVHHFVYMLIFANLICSHHLLYKHSELPPLVGADIVFEQGNVNNFLNWFIMFNWRFN